MKILRHKININWKYALSEVFLIFMSINLAIWFTNWNEQRKMQKSGQELLQEIRKEILLDTIDLTANIRSYEETIKDEIKLLKHIVNKRSFHDSIAFTFNALLNEQIITLHYSAFESLKSLGLELIQNDSLRNELIRLYDFDYKQVELL